MTTIELEGIFKFRIQSILPPLLHLVGRPLRPRFLRVSVAHRISFEPPVGKL